MSHQLQLKVALDAFGILKTIFTIDILFVQFCRLVTFLVIRLFLCLFQKKLMQSNVVLHVVMLTIHLCIKAGTNSQEKMEIDKIWSCFIFMGNRISTISISPIVFWQSLAAVLACLWHSGKHTHPILSRKLLSFKWDHSHPDLACRLGVVAKLSSFGSP